jgi:transmembrane sensor
MKTTESKAVEAAAAQWVVRRQAGLDAAGEREWTEWLAAAPAHAGAFQIQEAMAEVFQRARQRGAAAKIVTGVRMRMRMRVQHTRWLSAGALVACGCAFMFGWLPSERPTSPPAPASALVSAGPNQLRRLPDGSIVELERGAEIAVHFEASVRRVVLARGAALFRVESDASRPFVVLAEGTEVRAVGTAFQVRLGTESVSVLVTEGKVRVEATASRASVLPPAAEGEVPVLRAGQEAIVPRAEFGDAAVARVAEVSPEEIRSQLAWRVPRLSFDGVELASAVREINRHNRLQVILADKTLTGLRLSGEFSVDEPEAFARLAAEALGLTLHAEPANGRLVLTRR